ncbi:YeiH family protein [Marinicella sp. W31]|uniref:YeiH family protein n=1 Tax=Marinicella sp. W31 TaxID=3023713 RepID=UPI00375816BA
MGKLIEGIPGFVLVAFVAAVGYFLSDYFGLSSTLIAIAAGFLIGNVVPISERFRPGITWLECYGLSIAVALLGLQLNVATLLEINVTTIVMVAVSLIVTFSVALLLAQLLRMNLKASCLVASGQGICGSSAVLATQEIVKAPMATVGLIVALVNFLGLLGVFITPLLVEQFFQDDTNAAGFLIGNTLQSMGHVVAAGFSVNQEVGQTAVLIKMCRILFLIPVLFLCIYIVKRNRHKTDAADQRQQVHWLRLIPLFIWFFLLLCLLVNMQWIPESILVPMHHASDVLFTLAMVAIGMNIKIKDIGTNGGSLLLLGGLVFSVQIVFSVFLMLKF